MNYIKFKTYYLFIFVIVLSAVSWLISYKLGLTVTYNDAMAHLNISRLVIDNIQPGFSQLGGVWLPLNHLLAITLIWNSWAWHSGFAGSFYSMIAYVLSVLYIYKIVKYITNNTLAGIIGAGTFAINLNILYLQTTPLTEPVYLSILVISAYYFLKWMREDMDSRNLLMLGLLGLLQVTVRYDGWFVVVIEGFLIFIYLLFKRKSLSKSIGMVVFFYVPIIFGISLWILWNLLIFRNPLYFAIGPYSAHAQQAVFSSKSILITKGNILTSIKAYYYDILDNVGVVVLAFSIISIVFFLLKKIRSFRSIEKILFIAFLFSPIFFNVLALYFGFSILNVPQLRWYPSTDPSSQLFNVRYGILALPLISIGVGLFSIIKIDKVVFTLISGIVIAQSIIIYKTGVITVSDGLYGSSRYVNTDASVALNKIIKPNDKVILSNSYFSPLAFSSGINLDQEIHEGVSSEWNYALVKPQDYARVIVMSNGNTGDPVYSSLVINQRSNFLDYYRLAFSGQHANIYVLKTKKELYVKRQGSDLYLGESKFMVNGVNSYDLAYKSDIEIEDTFKQLNFDGVNTVRFWQFGEGNQNGFQPSAGDVNESMLAKSDLIISLANEYDIKLIPVLANNWTDYGGKVQYVKWVGQSPSDLPLFYTDTPVISLYKNYIDKIITRKNTLTHNLYANEPSILAWDIMNEPRAEGAGQSQFTAWGDNISGYIKSIDPNHLVTIGTEEVISPLNSPKQNSFCGLKNIDICSVHLYLYDNNGSPVFADQNELYTYLSNQERYVKNSNKAMLLEEFGISKQTQPFGNSNQVSLMSEIINKSRQLQYNGSLVWNYSEHPDATYGFSPDGYNGKYSLDDLKKLI